MTLPLPPTIQESYLQSHDLKYHVLSAGNPKHPLILCLHGFPELAFSWRKVMPALAEEGYFVVAYDQRGYGQTTGWDTRPFAEVDLSTFSLSRLVRDAVILVNALGYKKVACLIGHDFGGLIASLGALIRGDIFKSVIIMSHPFKGIPALPSQPVSGTTPSPPSKDTTLHELAELPTPLQHYKYYYSTSLAAPEMDNNGKDLHDFLRGYIYLKSADWDGNNPHPLEAWTATELSKLPPYYIMPLKSGMRDTVTSHLSAEDLKESKWLPDNELAVYAEAWKTTGFQGGLNWYRVATSPTSTADLQLYAGRKIDVPSMYIAGKQDWATFQEPGGLEAMETGVSCSKFKGSKIVDGAGHWVQQEQPEKVVELVARFLREVKVDAVTY